MIPSTPGPPPHGQAPVIVVYGPMYLDYAIFVLLGFIWGTNFLLMKLAVQVISPLQVTWLRVLCGAVPVLIYALARGRLRRADLKYSHHYLVLALSATVVPYLGFVKGTQYLKSGAAGSIAGIVPLLTAALSAVILPNDRLTWRKSIGLLVGCAGVALVARALEVFTGRSSGQELWGLAYMMSGAFGYAIAVVYTRRFVSPLKISPVALASYQMAIAAVILTFIAPKTGLEVFYARPDLGWMLALGLGAVGTGASFIMYYRVIESLGAVTASCVFYLPPMTALLMGTLFAGESVSLTQGAGALLIMLGINLARPRAAVPPSFASARA